MSDYYQHYILVDDAGLIVDGWSTGFRPEKSAGNAILLTSEGGYHFALLGEDNPALFSDVLHIPLYKWDGGRVIPRTGDEIEADRKAIPPAPPTELDKLSGKLDAAIQSNAMLEDCLVEMAGIVYA